MDLSPESGYEAWTLTSRRSYRDDMLGVTRSYTDRHLGVIGRLGELMALLRIHRTNIPGQVRWLLDAMRQRENAIEERLGEPLAGKRVLVVGPGQQLAEMTCLGVRNDVTGIDLDLIPQSSSLLEYWRMYSANGAMRTLKTLGRKAAGVDRSFQRELCRQLGLPAVPRHVVLTMDVTAMTFPDASFDCVYSHSCLEHVEDPKRAVTEIRRVLRPGGAARVEVHLYTSDNGCHDARIFAGKREAIPAWSHLRPRYCSRVRPNTYLNEVRLSDWRRMFTEQWPGTHFDHRPDGNPWLDRQLEELRANGELKEYTDEELRTMDLIVEWTKPGHLST